VAAEGSGGGGRCLKIGIERTDRPNGICWRLRDPAPTTLKAERKRLIWVNDQRAVAG
jgi:hypothetical protein